MTKHDWHRASAATLGRAIAAGELCPLELAESFLDAIDAHPDGARVYARTMRARAMDEAMAARSRARAGLRRGPLDGVPVSWKDLFDTAGTATEAGSALLRGRVPRRDALVLERMTDAGSVALGKTHTVEFAYSGLGLNPVTATPPNVNDPEAAPGGSSSGAAASVALGLAPLAIGSDTGGSVRVPAAWNDLVGLKTTHGRLPCTGVVPLARRFDSVGPIARTVEDAALALAAMEGARAPDLRGADLAGARLMVLEGAPFEDLRDAPRAGFEAAVQAFEAAGARITRARVAAVDAALPLSGVIYGPETWAEWRDLLEAEPERVFPPILERFRAGRDHTAADYVAAWLKLDRLRTEYAAATAGVDAVIVPTAPNMPPKVQRLMEDPAHFATENLLTLRNTRIANMLGLCALTLPTGTPSVGVSLVAGPMQDHRLLRLGQAAETALRRG